MEMEYEDLLHWRYTAEHKSDLASEFLDIKLDECELGRLLTMKQDEADKYLQALREEFETIWQTWLKQGGGKICDLIKNQ